MSKNLVTPVSYKVFLTFCSKCKKTLGIPHIV